MSPTCLSQLRHALAQLQPLSTARYAPAEQQTLRMVLSTTVAELRTLFPGHLSAGQQYHLLQNLSLLEQQLRSLAGTPNTAHSCAEWGAINATLQATIRQALSPYPTASLNG